MTMASLQTPKQRVMTKVLSMESTWSTWEAHIRELYEHMAPRRARWNTSDFNRGNKINSTIINNTPLLAARDFSAGFMSTVTNPVNTLFRFGLPDPEMMDYAPFKSYLHVCEERVRWLLQVSNWYGALADGIYPDLAIAGFSSMLLEDDPKILMRSTVFPLGEYRMSANSDGEIDTTVRKIPMTVRQFVGKFVWDGEKLDWSKSTPSTKQLWEKHDHETVIEVRHLIEPNWEWEPGVLGVRGKQFISLYFEAGDEVENHWAREGGYEEFPCVCPRWTVRGGESYGRSEGMNALGDAKQLQHHERRLALLIDKSANPPMVADASMEGRRLTIVPGEVTFAPRGQGEAFKPAMQVEPGVIVALLQHIQRAEMRIQDAMFSTLFSKLLRDARAQRATAKEIEEMSAQVATQVGPGLLRLNVELLRPSIDRAFNILERRGYLPSPPPELQGMEIRPEFISPLHQAQKTANIQPLRVFLGELAAAAQLKPSVLDKLDEDKYIDILADVTGISPDVVLAADEVKELRAVRAARQQAMEQGQAMLAATQGAKNLATSPAPAAGNALGAVLSNLSPQGAAQAAAEPLGNVAGGLLQ